MLLHLVKEVHRSCDLAADPETRANLRRVGNGVGKRRLPPFDIDEGHSTIDCGTGLLRCRAGVDGI
jgi:hypothetical protein